jgi:hypothetical protein
VLVHEPAALGWRAELEMLDKARDCSASLPFVLVDISEARVNPLACLRSEA